MAVYEVSAADLARKFREVEGRRPGLMVVAIRRAAAAGAEALAHVAPVGVTGQFKSKMRAIETSGGAILMDDAPYAGVIELGARPHWIGKRGLQALYEWFLYKLRLSAREAMSAAYAYRQKVAVEGQRPTYFMRKRLPTLRRILNAEIERVLKEQEA